MIYAEDMCNNEKIASLFRPRNTLRIHLLGKLGKICHEPIESAAINSANSIEHEKSITPFVVVNTIKTAQFNRLIAVRNTIASYLK